MCRVYSACTYVGGTITIKKRMTRCTIVHYIPTEQGLSGLLVEPCALVGAFCFPLMCYSTICCCDGLFVIVTLTLFVFVPVDVILLYWVAQCVSFIRLLTITYAWFCFYFSSRCACNLGVHMWDVQLQYLPQTDCPHQISWIMKCK